VVWFALRPTGQAKLSEDDAGFEARLVDYLRK
jgi:hypothetical protein